MIKFAIVEDEKRSSDALVQHIDKYFERHDGEYSVSVFDNAIKLLDNYRATYDVVFMDIEMPDLDGYTASQQLRKLDPKVILVFITNMKHYAVKGYAVDAMDFVIKPVERTAFFALLDKAMRIISQNSGKTIPVKVATGMRCVTVNEVRYIEVRRHRLTFHTEGEDFEVWGNLCDVEKQLPPEMFSRCNVGYLVSLSHVTAIKGEIVFLGEEELKISRPRRKAFLADLAKYYGSMR